jgi:hypothetical protein
MIILIIFFCLLFPLSLYVACKLKECSDEMEIYSNSKEYLGAEEYDLTNCHKPL